MLKYNNPAVISYCLFVISFMVFAYDITYDKDFFAWMWLLNSLSYFLMTIKFIIKT